MSVSGKILYVRCGSIVRSQQSANSGHLALNLMLRNSGIKIQKLLFKFISQQLVEVDNWPAVSVHSSTLHPMRICHEELH
jgi:hypothetical protein